MASEDLFEEFSEEIISALEGEQNKELEEDIAEVVEITENSSEVLTSSTEERKSNTPTEPKPFQLPLTRVRNIMKLDPDLEIASHEAVFLVTRATELFIQSLVREAFTYTATSKKKTIQKQDVDLAVAAVDSLMFLDGAMDFN